MGLHRTLRSLSLVALVACSPPAAPTAPASTSAPESPKPTASDAEPAAPVAPAKRPDAVTVLYRGRVPADIMKKSDNTIVATMFVGVERTREAAWLRHMISTTGTKVDELMRVPLSTNTVDPPALTRFSKGSSEKALVSYAGMLDALGTLPRNDEFLAVSREHILHEDGDHLTLRNKDGRSPRRFGDGPRAAYKPAFAPDGQTAAFWGCDDAIARRGKTLPEVQACYALYIAPTKGKALRISELTESSAPVFDADGRHVYATSLVRAKNDASKRDGGCFYRIDVAPPHAREKLFCASSENDALSFHLAPDGKSAIVGAKSLTPNLQMTYTWLGLPDGRTLGATTIPLASDVDAALGSSGLVVTSSGGGVVVADATGKIRTVPGLERAFVSIAPQWDGDSVYAIRREAPDRIEILRIDARAAIDAP